LDVFAAPRITTESTSDGAIVLRSDEPLAEHPPTVVHSFRANAERHPDRLFAAERHQGAWRELRWAEAARHARSIGQALIDRGLGPERPLMILSGNSLDHLQLMLGAFYARVPVLPISTAYSVLSRDHARIKEIAQLCSPGLAYADDGDAFAPAFAALGTACEAQVGIDALLRATPSAELDARLEQIQATDPAKIMFTSGSTGTPKGVITTHRMLASNQQALAQVWPFLRAEPPVLVDWLPWSHTFGGSHNLNQVLVFGGTLYIDDGKPAPDLFERTAATLRTISPTVYYNVPAGYALLAAALEQDDELCECFFGRLRFVFNAGSALPPALWERLRKIIETRAPREIPLTGSWGTTETAPAATTAHTQSAPCGSIGFPIPGVTIKLVRSGDKWEIRVKGPNITPGYYENPEATEEAFDEEGFYCPGDAVRLIDSSDPTLGLMFDGRIAENFKLTTGSWVFVAKLRLALVSEAGVLADAVIAGQDREYAAALAWLNQGEARRLLRRDSDVAIDDPGLRKHLAECLVRLNEGQGASSRIERLLLLDEPPSIDAGEITDKGYINQRAVLDRRTSDVERVYADPPGASVISAAGFRSPAGSGEAVAR
jgi:feruloyl-CoA synthase